MPDPDLQQLLAQVRACTLCSEHLDPRPVLRLARDSAVLVVGQAPGSRVHESGRPWDDASGEHLVQWLGVDRETFDDPDCFGILPMAFCYPGKGDGGDLPPPGVCAETWHERLLDRLPRVQLTLVVGMYAQRAWLGPRRKRTLTATVKAWRDFGPDLLPLPHPSWRSQIWMRRNPWFVAELLPELRLRVHRALEGQRQRL